LGLIPYEVSYLRWPAASITSPHPLTRFTELAFKLTSPPTPQGIPLPEAHPISLETETTPLGFWTSSFFSLLWKFYCYPAGLGYGGNPLYPPGAARVAANLHPFFALPSGL
jgi:hypothetical protein